MTLFGVVLGVGSFSARNAVLPSNEVLVALQVDGNFEGSAEEFLAQVVQPQILHVGSNSHLKIMKLSSCKKPKVEEAISFPILTSRVK